MIEARLLKDNIPRTMTLEGLKFIESLASQIKTGVYLEIGPLFGSSTDAIAKGRVSSDVSIHTIDTFENAPWIIKRLGIPLSRAKFESYTQHIENLTIYEGYAPDIVKNSWQEEIGFYFDDATHGNPGWMDNYNFFSQFFNEDTIICGDDFASGWPDVIHNVYKIKDKYNLKLYVIGRVWALTRGSERRLDDAVDISEPKLKGYDITVQHEDMTTTTKAAIWSYGLFKETILNRVKFSVPSCSAPINIVTSDGKIVIDHGSEIDSSNLQNIQSITIKGPRHLGVQYSILVKDQNGRKISWSNTKRISFNYPFVLPEHGMITAIRLSSK